jgi:molybdopterin converting factor small subunit
VDRLHERHERPRVRARRERVQIGHDAALDLLVAGHERLEGDERPRRRIVARAEQGRDVHARDPREPPEHLRARCAAAPEAALRDRVGDLERDLLALAHGEAVEEVRHRLRVERAGAAADDERICVAALAREERDPGELEQREDARVGELELERHPEEIEVADRRAGLEREERQAPLPEHALHVRPG